jgi:hypothetical protein
MGCLIAFFSSLSGFFLSFATAISAILLDEHQRIKNGPLFLYKWYAKILLMKVGMESLDRFRIELDQPGMRATSSK